MDPREPFGSLGFHRIRFCSRPASALDDCIALRHVMGFLAARLGIGLVDLHRQFAVRFEEPTSVAQVHTLLDE